MLKKRFHLIVLLGMTEEILHDIEPGVYRLHILQRKQQPATQQSCAHRAYRAVNDIEQALAFVAHSLDQLKIAHGKLVKTHVALLLDARQARYVARHRVLGYVEIVQHRTRGDDGGMEGMYSKALEVACFKLFQQLVVGGLVGEYPVVELEDKITR